MSRLRAYPVGRRKPNRVASAVAPVATSTPWQTIQGKYERGRDFCGDTIEHFPTLRSYAAQSRDVTEMGVRSVCSSWALLMGRPAKMRSYDIKRTPEMDELERLGAQVCDFKLLIADVLAVEIDETDFLFIDTLHTYRQLRAELFRHAPRVRRWIALHDTETFGTCGEDKQEPGLAHAIEEFIDVHPEWSVLERYSNCNGLTVLGRR